MDAQAVAGTIMAITLTAHTLMQEMNSKVHSLLGDTRAIKEEKLSFIADGKTLILYLLHHLDERKAF